MKKQVISIGIGLLFALGSPGDSGAFLEAPSLHTEDQRILIDIWLPEENPAQPTRISLLISGDEESGPGSPVTVTEPDTADPWWADKIILHRAHRGIEVVRSMTRIVWKIAIRVAPVPAIY